MDIPIGSGPYKIGPVRFGKDITYVRDPDYWARDLGVKRGSYNFERITVKIYKDNTARLEALKAGEFDMMSFYSAGDWARRVTGKRFDFGRAGQARLPAQAALGLPELRAQQPPAPAGRRARARGAGPGDGLRVDEPPDVLRQLPAREGPVRQHRLRGQRHAVAAGARAAGAAGAARFPDAVFGPMYRAAGHRRARPVAARQPAPRQAAAERGRLDATATARCATPRASRWCSSTWTAAKAASAPCRRGCATSRSSASRCSSRSVDFALYQQRLDKFEFDITTINFPGTHNPGQQLADDLRQQGGRRPRVRATTWASSSPAVDALIAKVVAADRPRPSCCRPAARSTA